LREGLLRELWTLVGILLVTLVLGAIAGHPFAGLVVGLALYLGLMLRQLARLHAWLQTGRSADVPEAGGLWGDAFDAIRQLIKKTERREDRLTKALERFQSASAATPDAMVVLTEGGKIEWANRAAERLLGLAYPRDHGLRITNLVREPEFGNYLRQRDFGNELTMGSPVRDEIELSIQIIPFGSSERLLIARDVTLVARLEAMRRNFVANISHELRTPLTVVTGYIETLQDSIEPDAREPQRYLASMHEQALRMLRLVDDLLTLSRLETSPPLRHESEVDVAAMLEGLKETAEVLSGDRHHVLGLEADPDLQLLGNEEELRSALSNLISNAVRYTPAGGSIRLSWRAANGGAVFAVTDSGEGIPAHHIPHLTERFYRVDNARSRATGGTGLGLSIVKHILMRHDARLGIDSRIGQGSTFSCYFPASRTVKKQ
jgi:two-component system phosphate regulon sensor histidine kinase PhoR